MAETLKVGNWHINAAEGWIARRPLARLRRVRPDPRLMAVLRVLLERAGELVTVDEILALAWPDRVVSRDSVSTAIYELRRMLGDDAAAPVYIRTEPRRGYRLIANVRRPDAASLRRTTAITTAGAALLAAGLAWLGGSAMPVERPALFITPLEDSTSDSRYGAISEAIDATLTSALISRNPRRVSSEPPSASGGSYTLETKLVACDLGPALVVRLRAPESGRYLWSKSYSLDAGTPEITLVEHVARDVSLVLSDT